MKGTCGGLGLVDIRPQCINELGRRRTASRAHAPGRAGAATAGRVWSAAMHAGQAHAKAGGLESDRRRSPPPTGQS